MVLWLVFATIATYVSAQGTVIPDDIPLPCGEEFKNEGKCDDRGDSLMKRISELRSSTFKTIFQDCPKVVGGGGDELSGILSCDCTSKLQYFYPDLPDELLALANQRGINVGEPFTQREFGCLGPDDIEISNFFDLYTPESGFTKCKNSTWDEEKDEVDANKRRMVDLSLLPTSLAPNGLLIGRMCAQTFNMCLLLDKNYGTKEKGVVVEKKECPFLQVGHRGGIKRALCPDAFVKAYKCDCDALRKLGEECKEQYGRVCYKDDECVLNPDQLQILCDINTGYYLEWYDYCPHRQDYEDITRESKFLTYYCWSWIQPTAVNTIFIMDMSSSIKSRMWDIEKAFFRTLIDKGVYETSKIGLITFSDDAVPAFDYPTTKSNVLANIMDMKKSGQRTNTQAAFSLALDMLAKAGLDGMGKTIVFLTDGLPTPTKRNPCLANDDGDIEILQRLNAMSVNVLSFLVGLSKSNGKQIDCLWNTFATNAIREVIRVPYIENFQAVVDKPECFDWAVDKEWLEELRKAKGGRGDRNKDPIAGDCGNVNEDKTGKSGIDLQRYCRNYGNNKCMWSKRQDKCVDYVAPTLKKATCGEIDDEDRCNARELNRNCEWTGSKCEDKDTTYASWADFQKEFTGKADYDTQEKCEAKKFLMWVVNQKLCIPKPIRTQKCRLYKEEEEHCVRIPGCKWRPERTNDKGKKKKSACTGKIDW